MSESVDFYRRRNVILISFNYFFLGSSRWKKKKKKKKKETIKKLEFLLPLKGEAIFYIYTMQ